MGWSHRRSRSIEVQGTPAAYRSVIRLWILRLLVRFGGSRALVQEHQVTDEALVRFLGLGRWLETDPFSPAALRQQLRDSHARLEAKAPSLPTGTALARNVAWLGDLLGLSVVDRDILQLAVLQQQHPVLEGALNLMGGLTLGALHRLFALVLGRPLAGVRQALRASGALARTGLVTVDLRSRYTFDNKVELLPGLADRLLTRNENPLAMFRRNFVPAPAGHLKAGDYPHLAQDLALLEAYLRDALATRGRGVNVLLHGLPGSGKTQFARMLAQRLGCRLFEVAAEDSDGEAIQGVTRFASYRLAQAILMSVSPSMILFDEVEDVFCRRAEGGPEMGRARTVAKGCINQTLEENPVPAVWITNAPAAMDPAYLRRFDVVLELGVPPRSVRAKVLHQHLGRLGVPSAVAAILAEHDRLVPAVVARASKVVRCARKVDPGLDPSAAFTRVMGHTLEVLGEPRAPQAGQALPLDYRPDLLRTDCDLAVLTAGLKDQGRGRLCFSGPPGTGKTAFARHLAEVLDRPLLARRASDLQSKWVGETEQHLARMFQEAGEERAVLLLDEADSFLQDRREAHRSWEVSQVNELLTQMEGFSGVFIAATNFPDRLDSAALRRFDLKVRFDFLDGNQAWAMFQATAARLGLQPEAPAQAALGRLAWLTPGDFANVLQQARLRRIANCAELVERLAAECRVKPEGRRAAIGFRGLAMPVASERQKPDLRRCGE